MRDRLPEAVAALRWDRVVLPRPLAAVGTVVAGLAVVVVVVGAVLVAGHDYPSALDSRFDPAIAALRMGRGALFAVIVAVGNVMSVAVLTVVLTTICLATGRPRLALLALVAPAVTGAATMALKPLIGRTMDGAYSYPSGHTGAATTLALVTGLLLVSVPAVRRTVARIAVLVVVTVLGAVPMGIALVALHVHYPTDTVAGAATALVVVPVLAVLVDRAGARVLDHRGATTPPPDRAGR